MWRHDSWTNQRTALLMEDAFEASLWIKLRIKTTREMIRYSAGKVTGNQQEDWSSHREVRKRFVEPFSPRVVDAYRKQRQLRWSTTDPHLICINTTGSGLGWRRTAWWSTSQRHVDGGRQNEEDDKFWESLPHLLLACKSHIDTKM